MKSLIVTLVVILFLGITALWLSVVSSRRADAQTKLLVSVGYCGMLYFLVVTIYHAQ